MQTAQAESSRPHVPLL